MAMADCACITTDTKKKTPKLSWSWIFQIFLVLVKWFSQKVSIKQKFKNRTSQIWYTVTPVRIWCLSAIQCQRLSGLEVFHFFHSAKTEKLACLLLGVNLSLPSFGGCARQKRVTSGCLCSLPCPAVPNGNIPFSCTVRHSLHASFKSNLGLKTQIQGFTHVCCSFWSTKMPKWSPAAWFYFSNKNWLKLVVHTWGLLNDASKSFKNRCKIGSQVC